MSRMRQAVARLMSQSKREAPHFYLSMDVRMDAASELLAEVNRGSVNNCTATALMVRALAESLVRHPSVNAHIVDGEPVPRDEVSIGVAVATGDGLLAPALLDMAGRSLDEVAGALTDLVERARAGRLKGRELSGATFTLSNLGMHQVTSFSAIINPPQVAILAVGQIEDRVVAHDGSPKVVKAMTATLSADHRALDGAEAAAFLGDFREVVEDPRDLC